MPIRTNFGNWTKFIAKSGNKPTKVIPFGARKGRRNKKGVKRVMCNGYVHIFNPLHPLAMKNGYAREHRIMAYDAGMLKNLSDEVHHKNEIKTDNRLSNFEIITKSKHASITWRGKKRKKWTKKMRQEKSRQMMGNKNHSHPDLLGSIK